MRRVSRDEKPVKNRKDNTKSFKERPAGGSEDGELFLNLGIFIMKVTAIMRGYDDSFG